MLTIYSASAGSGKTYTLALKYISMALSSAQPTAYAGILAVTFTNKATAEMKDRILAGLWSIAHAGVSDRHFYADVRRATSLDDETLQGRAAATLRAIMHDYDRFRVTTIDAFFQSLLTNLAHELGLTRGFRVELDDKAKVDEAVNRLLLTLGDPALQNERPELIRAVLNYIDVAVDENSGWDISKTLKKFAKDNLFKADYQAHSDPLERATADPERLEQLRHALSETMQEIEKDMDEERKRFDDCFAERTQKFYNGNHTKWTVSYSARLYDPKEYSSPLSDTLAKVLETDGAHFLKKASADDPAALSEARTMADALRRLHEKAQRRCVTYNTCALTRARLSQLSLLSAISAEVTRLTGEQGTFLLAKTPELFRQMVGERDTSFVFEKAGTTLHHFMIDEFQDTSHVQWENFSRLLREKMAQGEECMVVGDIKQSIYRWRDGDWQILFGLKREAERQTGPDAQMSAHSLGTNFRSRREVVRFNNAFFTKAATLLDEQTWSVPDDWETRTGALISDEERAAFAPVEGHVPFVDLYDDVIQKPKNEEAGGYVRIALKESATLAGEVLGEVAEEIRHLHDDLGVPYRKIAILVRRNKEATQVVDYYSAGANALPVTSDTAFLLSASMPVLTVVAVLRYVESMQFVPAPNGDGAQQAVPADTVALAYVRQALWTMGMEEFAYEKEGADFFRALQRMPLLELITKVIDELILADDAEALQGDAPYLFSFMDYVRDYLTDHTGGLTDFLAYWDDTLGEKSIACSEADSVRVLTIHKSKGLQFHSVFMPFVDTKVVNAMGDFVWCPTEGLDVPEDNAPIRQAFSLLPIVPVPFRTEKDFGHSAYADYYAREYFEQQTDALNTLYVAFTRAEQNLFIWSKQAGSTTFMWLDAFVHDHQPGFAYVAPKDKGPHFEESVTEYGKLEGLAPEMLPHPAPAAEEEEKKQLENPFANCAVEHIRIVPQRGDERRVEFRQSNRARRFVAALLTEEEKTEYERSDSYIHRGLLLHSLFSLIATRADLPGAVQTLRAQGLIASEDEARTLRAEMEGYLDTPEVAQWFDGSCALFNECNILLPRSMRREGERRRRPDRVMITPEGEALVVDYKFGAEREEHAEQVLTYMHLLAAMGYTRVSGRIWYVGRKIVTV